MKDLVGCWVTTQVDSETCVQVDAVVGVEASRQADRSVYRQIYSQVDAKVEGSVESYVFVQVEGACEQ